jgi:hypothetical protein
MPERQPIGLHAVKSSPISAAVSGVLDQERQADRQRRGVAESASASRFAAGNAFEGSAGPGVYLDDRPTDRRVHDQEDLGPS